MGAGCGPGLKLDRGSLFSPALEEFRNIPEVCHPVKSVIHRNSDNNERNFTKLFRIASILDL